MSTEYDFSQLNDKEFEILVADLLSAEFNQRIERFKPGRDQGVDARFFTTNGNEVIIQCKHYLNSGVATLTRNLKKVEKDKVKSLNCKRYIVATSCPLTRKNKKVIKKDLEPYILNESDIYGQEDINDLLKKNESILRNHYKLWMHSATVLEQLLNIAVYSRSSDFLDEAKEKAKFFVETADFKIAKNKIKQQKVIIISGEPGVGKTTLTEALSLNAALEGYEIIQIFEIIEGENALPLDKKQLFIFDDFLGSNYLDAIENRQDSKIVSFIRRVEKSHDKLLILNTRTSIYNQGLSLSDKFKHSNMKNQRYLIKVDELTELEKAEILYNHLWHSGVSSRYIDEIYKDQRYLDIIQHHGFNPRIIEHITLLFSEDKIDSKGSGASSKIA